MYLMALSDDPLINFIAGRYALYHYVFFEAQPTLILHLSTKLKTVVFEII